ncbi:MAG: zf-HC2 domain-containing protein [Clostridiales bacterium]
MKCQSASNLLMRYIDNELNDLEKLELEHHIKDCRSCCKEFEAMEYMIEMIDLKEDISPPDNFEELVMGKIKNENSISKYKKINYQKHIIFLAALFTLMIVTYKTLWALVLSKFEVFKAFEIVINNTFKIVFNSYSIIIEVIFKFAYDYYYVIVLLIVMIYAICQLIFVKIREYRAS